MNVDSLLLTLALEAGHAEARIADAEGKAAVEAAEKEARKAAAAAAREASEAARVAALGPAGELAWEGLCCV
jgi:Tfp pilus assembly protein PilN